MSADNGIYILKTTGPVGPEYRVTHAQAIDNIYGNFSDESFQWQGDPEEMYKYFHEAPVFSSVEKALDYAEELSYNYDYLEYGICVISEFKDWNFNRLKERYGKEAEGSTW